MVIGDDSQENGSRREGFGFSRGMLCLAMPFDRLAANIADFVFCLPLASVAFAFLKKEIVLAQILGSEPEFYAYVLLYIFALIGFGICYQLFFLSLVGFTPGKFFFGIKVVDVWTRKTPHWHKICLRTAMWWVDMITLVPLLAVFFDSHRRPIHDRLADTLVLSVRAKNSGLPSALESFLARLVFTIGLAGAILWVVFGLNLVDVTSVRGAALSNWFGKGEYCSSIDEAVGQWVNYSQPLRRRLEVAMALFAADEIGKDCLNSEAEALLWKKHVSNEDKSLAYLARAVVFLEAESEFESYLQKVCDESMSSEACKVSGFLESFERWDDGDLKTVFPYAKLALTSDYAKIWAARFYYRQGDSESVRALLRDLSPNPHISRFLAEFRIKTLWRGGEYDTAEEVWQIQWDNQRERSENMRLGWWLCSQELIRGCMHQQSPSCRSVEREALASLSSELAVSVGLVLLRKQDCGGSWDRKLASRYPPEISAYWEQLRAEGSADKKMAELSFIALQNHYSPQVKWDASMRLIAQAEKFEQVADLVKHWLTGKHGNFWDWHSLGEKIHEKMMALQKYNLALEVAKKMYAKYPNEANRRRKVVSYYRTGDTTAAWKWVQAFSHESSQRKPAAVDPYEEVEAALRESLGEK